METKENTCCFTGHRPGKLPWGYDESDARCQLLKERMGDAIDAVYREGYRHFLIGMAQGCDLYFCQRVLRYREDHPEVTVEAVLPCPTQADAWPPREKARYKDMIAACDRETMVSHQYTPYCMQRRDRYMVDHASLLVAAFNGSAGGTWYTVAYAMRQGLRIVDLPIL